MKKAKMKVDADLIIGKIDPHVYGQLIEFLGRCINSGLWAEMLKNRKFGAEEPASYEKLSRAICAKTPERTCASRRCR